MIPQAKEIESLATKYSKPQLQQMAQLGQINPQTAVLAGMMIDRIMQSNMQPPQTTVAQDVMGDSQEAMGMGALPANGMAPPQMPAPMPGMPGGMPPAMEAPPMMAEGGLLSLPVPDSMYDEDSFAGGGIVAFSQGDSVVDRVNLQTIRGNRPKHPNEERVVAEALRQGLDPSIALYALYRETGGLDSPDTAVSPKGALGSLQVMPTTAMDPGYGVPSIFDLAGERGINVSSRDKPTAESLLRNPELNDAMGINYLSAMQKRFNDPKLALAAYNAGPGAVNRAGGVPNFSETQNYVADLGDDVMPADVASGAYADRRLKAAGVAYEPTGDEMPADVASGAFADRKLAEAGVRYGATEPETPSMNIQDILSRSGRLARGISPLGDQKVITPEEANRQTTEGLRLAGFDPELISKQRAELEKEKAALAGDRKTAQNMRLIEAGLAIMAGESPNAFVNIGKGATPALQGLSKDLKDIKTAERAYNQAQRDLDKKQNEFAMGKAGINQKVVEKSQDRVDVRAKEVRELQGGLAKTMLAGEIQKEIAKSQFGGKITDFDKQWALYVADAKRRGETPSFDGFQRAIAGTRAELTYKDVALAVMKDTPGIDPKELDATVRSILRNQQTALGRATPPANAVDALKKDPSLASQFDAKYGQGAAARVLGK